MGTERVDAETMVSAYNEGYADGKKERDAAIAELVSALIAAIDCLNLTGDFPATVRTLNEYVAKHRHRDT